MTWNEIRAQHPETWVIVEALAARSEQGRRIVDQLDVVGVCADGGEAFRRYRELHAERPDRELYFAHTGNPSLEIDERPWVGFRWDHAPSPQR